MPIRVQCGACGREYQLKDQFAGRTVKCPNCGGAIVALAVAAAGSPISFPGQEASTVPPASGGYGAPPTPWGGEAAPGYGASPSYGVASDFGAAPGYGASPRYGAAPGYGAPAYGAATGQPVHDYGSPYANFAFNRDKFLLRQKVMAISAKYYVWDEQGRSILFVERPAHLLRNLAALLGGLVAGFLTFFFIVTLFYTAAAATQYQPLVAPGFLLGIPAGIVMFFAIKTLLCKKRHVTIFQDDTKQAPLLQIFQDKKFWIIHGTYTVADMQGQMLARFHKNNLYNLFRKRWEVLSPQGEMMYLAKEDSILLGLVRRFITNLLVTNFIIVAPQDDTIKLGEFNRKFTLLDRYVLDLSPDWQRQLDRRVALALGIMLDTGESR